MSREADLNRSRSVVMDCIPELIALWDAANLWDTGASNVLRDELDALNKRALATEAYKSALNEINGARPLPLEYQL